MSPMEKRVAEEIRRIDELAEKTREYAIERGIDFGALVGMAAANMPEKLTIRKGFSPDLIKQMVDAEMSFFPEPEISCVVQCPPSKKG